MCICIAINYKACIIQLLLKRNETDMKNLGDLNNWTKNDLARVITQALFNADKPLPADHFQVRRQMKQSKAHLVRQADKAINILSNRAMAKL